MKCRPLARSQLLPEKRPSPEFPCRSGQFGYNREPMGSSPAAMAEPARPARPVLPPGFGARRGLNWSVVGFLYTSFYMCRYNLSIANKPISDEFGFSKGDMGDILGAQFYAYAIG